MIKPIEKIGIANSVTLARILLIPIFLLVLMLDWPNWSICKNWYSTALILQPILAALVFAAIAATDAVDGYLARSRNEITTFGKFMDPLADKLLVTAALLALTQLGSVPAIVSFIIIAREFVVSGLRMIAVAEGVVIAASPLGKFKTVLQIIALTMLILSNSAAMTLLPSLGQTIFSTLSIIMLTAAVIVTIWSMVDYFMKASQSLKGPWNH